MAGEVEIESKVTVVPAELKEELKELIVGDVKSTGKLLGVGAYGSVEEVLISGTEIAAVKKLHPKLIELGSPHQVCRLYNSFLSGIAIYM